MKDEQFIRGKVPMTKEEIRTITISKMDINPKSIILDIGGGTGSIAIECAIKTPKGHVTTIEKNEEAVGLIHKNAEKFKVDNLTIIDGKAPEDLPMYGEFESIVIGGSGGNMKSILDYCKNHLKENGKIVGNMITLENMYLFLRYCKANFSETEIIHVNVSKGKDIKDLTMMMASNGIYIISAKKI